MNAQVNTTKEDFFQAAPSTSPGSAIQAAPSTSTRGHSMKLAKPTAQSRVLSNFWSVRITNDWNSLPDNIVQA